MLLPINNDREKMTLCEAILGLIISAILIAVILVLLFELFECKL